MDTYQSSSGPNKMFVFVFGLLIGVLLLGGGLFVYSRYFNSSEESVSNFTVTPTKELALSVTSPASGETVSTKNVKISGNAGVASVLVINGGKEDTIVETTTGAFSINYPLSLGENQVTVTAYDENTGESRIQTLDLLYLDENLDTL